MTRKRAERTKSTSRDKDSGCSVCLASSEFLRNLNHADRLTRDISEVCYREQAIREGKKALASLELANAAAATVKLRWLSERAVL